MSTKENKPRKRRIIKKSEPVIQPELDLIVEAETPKQEEVAGNEEEVKVEETKEEVVEVQVEAPKDSTPTRLTVEEIVLKIKSSTPTIAFGRSLFFFFEDNPQAVITISYMGAACHAQVTNSIIEANKLLVAKGRMISRFDYWRNQDDKSISNTRLILTDILPNSLGAILVGKDVDYRVINGGTEQ